MRAGIHLVAVLAASVVSASVGVGCATKLDVVFDEREDFSRYRSWDWLRHGVPRVDAPQADAGALDAHLARLIERRLLESGFERAGDRADFLVTYRLGLRRRALLVNEPMAPYLLSSHHSSASYWIEGSQQVLRVYDDIRLLIGITDTDGRSIWHGTLERRVEYRPSLPLRDAVATLLERFPPAVPGPDPPQRERERPPERAGELPAGPAAAR